MTAQLVLDLTPAPTERPGFAWRCIDCTWSSRARGAVAHQQVRTHHTVTGHALHCREVLAS